MHDPMTVAFTIRYPWRAYPASKTRGIAGAGFSEFERTYRHPFITIWHVDPEKGPGGDDSCGWFMRSCHGDKAVLAKIVKRFEMDWDRVFISDESSKMYPVGMFKPDGSPRLSPTGIVVNLFFLAALETFGRMRARKWMQRNLFEIMLFAENPFDSLYDGIVGTFGFDDRKSARQDRVEGLASTIYGWILRERQPWYRHPRWHVWHWKLQVHPWQSLRRFLLTRCAVCGGTFKYGESPVSDQWDRSPPKFMRGEGGLRHSNCSTVGIRDEGVPT